MGDVRNQDLSRADISSGQAMALAAAALNTVGRIKDAHERVADAVNSADRIRDQTVARERLAFTTAVTAALRDYDEAYRGLMGDDDEPDDEPYGDDDD